MQVKPGQYKVTLPLALGFEFDMSSHREIILVEKLGKFTLTAHQVFSPAGPGYKFKVHAHAFLCNAHILNYY